MLKAVLFDCDGVLLDSESIYLSCVVRYLETLGVTTSVPQISHLVGADIQLITERLRKDYSLEAYSTEELIRGQRALFNRRFYGEKLKAMGGLLDFLKQLKREKLLMAVVSSSARQYVKYVLEQLEIEEYFDLYVGREDVVHAKPSPELYLEAIKRLGIEPVEAVVLEDSAAGILAARRAGCRVIAYQGAEVKQDVSAADMVAAQYGELDAELLRNLCNPTAGPSAF